MTEMEKPFLARVTETVRMRSSLLLDKSVPHGFLRWIVFLLLIFTFGLRIYMIEGFYIVVYGLGIYLLNLLIGFLAPSESEAEMLEARLSGVSLPQRASDEFRPFSRRLPEFKVWLSGCKAVCVCFIMTFFSIFDIPVFWPVLLMYFCILFVLTMKRQIKHMIKYKYVPIPWGKPRYASGSGASAGSAGGSGAQVISKKNSGGFQRPLPKVRRPLRSMPDSNPGSTNSNTGGIVSSGHAMGVSSADASGLKRVRRD